MANCHLEDVLHMRDDLVTLLNEDLAREYQAIISYLVYSQVIKGPQYMMIAAELERHAAEELAHAMVIAAQVSYLGGDARNLFEARPGVALSRGDAALRSGKRGRDNRALPCASPAV